MIPVIATVAPANVSARVLDDDDGVDMVSREALDRSVDVGLERDLLAAAHTFVGRNHDVRFAVLDAAAERFGRKAAENDGVNRADARTGEHRDGCLRNHRHVDRDTIAFLDAEIAHRAPESAYTLVQLPIRDLAVDGRVVAFPDDRRLIAACLQMPI